MKRDPNAGAQELVERLRKMAGSVYLAAEESVADDIAGGLRAAAETLEAVEEWKDRHERIWLRRIDDAQAERDEFRRNASMAVERRLEAAEAKLEVSKRRFLAVANIVNGAIDDYNNEKAARREAEKRQRDAEQIADEVIAKLEASERRAQLYENAQCITCAKDLAQEQIDIAALRERAQELEHSRDSALQAAATAEQSLDDVTDAWTIKYHNMRHAKEAAEQRAQELERELDEARSSFKCEEPEYGAGLHEERRQRAEAAERRAHELERERDELRVDFDAQIQESRRLLRDRDAFWLSLEAAEPRAQTVRELAADWRLRVALIPRSDAKRAMLTCANELEAVLAEPEPKP